jgi:hypothetical protein
MTRADYRRLARALNSVKPLIGDSRKHDQWADVLMAIGQELEEDNPRFDWVRFREAAHGR